MPMDPKETRKYNIANLLLAVLLKKCKSDSRKNTEQMAKALAERAKSTSEPKLRDETENLKKYLTQSSEPVARLEEYINWISTELGKRYSSSDLNQRLTVDSELRDDIAACRAILKLSALEEGQSIDAGFYEILINRWWEKSVTSIDLQNMRDDDALPNYMLYQSFSAANLWEHVSKYPHYLLPRYCRLGLERILQSNTFREFAETKRIFFELGTGSPKKTTLILDNLNATGLGHRYIWIDASTPMLEYNVSKVDISIYPALKFNVVSTDFEEVDDLLQYLGKRLENDGFRVLRKCYFLLGFTLSNLNEARFISNYAKACDKGDVLIFPMQFIPDAYEPPEAWAGIETSDYGKQLIQAYNSQEGFNLVRAGLSQIKGQTGDMTAKAQPIKSVLGTPSIDCIGRSIVIRYMAHFHHEKRQGGTAEKKLEIIKASRYFERDFRHFVELHGFEIKEAVSVAENVKAFLIQFVGSKMDNQSIGDSE